MKQDATAIELLVRNELAAHAYEEVGCGAAMQGSSDVTLRWSTR
ncbi:MAG: hypothetical protein JWN43_4157 [Gammaproteobacteria bacterium]|nr:hypothetical protein [Gammaproteobacteria bacterium]